jgi:hypothetical protein
MHAFVSLNAAVSVPGGDYAAREQQRTAVLQFEYPPGIPARDTHVTGAEMNAGIPISSLPGVCPRIVKPSDSKV